MVVPIKRWLLVIDIPKYIYEMQKRGYNHFEADFTQDSRRVELKAWRRREKIPKRFECESCPDSFPNRSAKRLHQIQLGHGGFRKPLPLIETVIPRIEERVEA